MPPDMRHSPPVEPDYRLSDSEAAARGGGPSSGSDAADDMRRHSAELERQVIEMRALVTHLQGGATAAKLAAGGPAARPAPVKTREGGEAANPGHHGEVSLRTADADAAAAPPPAPRHTLAMDWEADAAVVSKRDEPVRVRLSSLLAAGPVLLSFFRGGWTSRSDVATWRLLQCLHDHCGPEGAAVLALSTYGIRHSRANATLHGTCTLPIVHDRGDKLAAAFGVPRPRAELPVGSAAAATAHPSSSPASRMSAEGLACSSSPSRAALAAHPSRGCLLRPDVAISPRESAAASRFGCADAPDTDAAAGSLTIFLVDQTGHVAWSSEEMGEPSGPDDDKPTPHTYAAAQSSPSMPGHCHGGAALATAPAAARRIAAAASEALASLLATQPLHFLEAPPQMRRLSPHLMPHRGLSSSSLLASSSGPHRRPILASPASLTLRRMSIDLGSIIHDDER